MIITRHNNLEKAMAIADVAMLTVAALLFSTGCLSFPLGNPKVPITTTSVTSGIARDAPNDIEEFSPSATRLEPNTVKITFIVRGTINLREVHETKIEHGAEERLSIGFFPGAACETNSVDAMAWAAESIWYNIIFVGLPTVSGLLIEPFIPASPGKGSAFSRSAIIGCHRWGYKPATKTTQKTSSKATECILLNGYSCEVNGASSVVVDKDGNCTAYGFPAAAKSLKVTLSIPNTHPLKRQLEPFEKEPISIRLPEK